MATLLGLLIFIFGSVYCVYGIYHLLTRKYLNPWKLYLLLGDKGSGKTSTIVKKSLKFLRRGYHVYTNMEDCLIPGVRIFKGSHLGDFVPEGHSVLMIDEAGMEWDCRDFAKFKPSVREFWKLQRHRKVIVYLTTQRFDIDKKIRDLCDGIYFHVKRFRVLSVGKRVLKRTKLSDPVGDQSSNFVEQMSFAPFWLHAYTYIPRYVGFYDSYHVPYRPPLPYKTVEGELPRSFFSTQLNKIKIWLQGKKGAEK